MFERIFKRTEYISQQQSGAPQQAPFYFQAEYLTISIDAENNWLYANWLGYQTEGSVKEGCEKMLEALQAYKLEKVLNDNTHVLGIWTPAAHWVGTDWFPRMEAAGLKYFAWIYSPSRLSQVSTNESINNTPLPHLIKTFYKKEEAEDWLRRVV